MEIEICRENYNTTTKETSPEYSYSTKLDQSIQRIIENEGFVKYKIKKQPISTNGGNFLGELYEVDVKGISNAGDKELNLFIKNIIKPDSFKVVSVTDVYKNELFAYKELSKLFEKLQEEANVPLEERYKMVKAYDETDENKIIMENIAKKGFTTYHRMDVVSLKFLELCITNLARFHGLSFALKEKLPEYFNKKIKPLKHPLVFEEDYKQLVERIAEIAIKNIDDHLKEKVKEIYKDLVPKFAEYLNDENIKICLCHGDYRPNNIMMKVKNGEILDVIPVDYQLNHYGCPVFDLLYLIYFSTDRSLRRDHMPYLKDLYYSNLGNFLKYFGLDAQTVYPRNEFEKVYAEKLDYGLLLALQVLPVIFASEDDVPDVSEGMGFDFNFQVSDGLKERLHGVIEDFVEWGYI